MCYGSIPVTATPTSFYACSVIPPAKVSRNFTAHVWHRMKVHVGSPSAHSATSLLLDAGHTQQVSAQKHSQILSTR